LQRIARDFIVLFKQPKAIVQFICAEVCHLIDCSVVDSMPSEDKCFRLLRMSYIVLETTKLQMSGFFDYEVQILQIDFLLKFVAQRVWALHGLTYSLRNFQDPNFLDSLIGICFRADLIDLLNDATVIWPARLGSVRLQTLSNICRLGHLNEGQTYLQQLSPKDFEPRAIEELFSLLSYPIPTDVSLVPVHSKLGNLSEPLQFKPGKRLRVTSVYPRAREMLHDKTEVNTRQTAIRNELLHRLGCDGNQIMLHAVHGEFKEAFALWGRQRQGFAGAVKIIFIPALSYGHWESLWDFVEANRPGDFRPVLQSFFFFCP
jgi:hypothetical protein